MMDRNLVLSILRGQVSRRQFLKMTGVGVAAGTSFLSGCGDDDHHPTTGGGLGGPDPTQLQWSLSLPGDLNDTPLFAGGTIIVPIKSASIEADEIYSFDVQTQALRWSQGVDGDDQSTPLLRNGTLFMRDTDHLHAVDFATGDPLWHSTYTIRQELAFAGGNLVFPTDDGRIVAVDVQGNQVWARPVAGSGVSSSSSAVVSGSVVMVIFGDTVFAVSALTGALLWTQVTGDNTQRSLSIGNGNVYFRVGGFLRALDIVTGQQRWQWPPAASAAALASPWYYNGALYVYDLGGRFSAVQPDVGTTLWQLGLPGQGELLFDLPVYFEDGVAYFAFTNGAESMLYAVDLPSQGQQIVSFSPAGVNEIVGVETGICYFSDTYTTIGAVDLTDGVRQFFCESELMVEDYAAAASGPGYQPSTTSFRTHLQLFDPNKNPRAGASVKVWASEAMTIASGGKTYPIDPMTSVWLQADSFGELSLVSTADSITSPALYLWGNFMDVGEAMVVYPDHDTLGRLSTLQESDLSASKSYDGSAMLPSTYTAKQTSDLAAMIRNTVGGTAQAMEATRQMHLAASPGAADGYLAFPKSSPNILFQPMAGSSDRMYMPGELTQWVAEFDTAGGVTFTPGAGLADVEGIAKAFDDFVNDVVKGARKVARVVWNWAENAAQTIYDDLGNAYQFVVGAVEHAAAVVAGALKTVVGDIKKAVQWLSYLFDWSDILSIHTQISNLVMSRFDGLKTWVGAQITNDIAAVHTFFQGLESSIDNSFAEALSAIGGGTLQAQQKNGNNPQTLYGAGGGKSYVKSRWLFEKVKSNSAQAMIAFPSDPGDSFLTAIEKLVSDINTRIETDSAFASIPDDLKNVFSDFSKLATDPSEFATQSIEDIFDLVRDIVVALIQLLDAIVESLLDVLQDLIDATIAVVTQPIQIPIISELYSHLTGGATLSLIDLCSLVVAVPTTIIQKALASTASGNVVGAISLTDNIGFICAGAFYAVLDAFNDGLDIGVVGKSFYLGFGILLEGLSFPVDIAQNLTGDYLFYAATVTPLILAAVDIHYARKAAENENEDEEDPAVAVWSKVAPSIGLVYGLAMLGASIGLAVTNANYRGKDYLLMVQNIFTFLPYPFKPLSLGPEPAKAALGIIDGVCDITAVILSVVLGGVCEGTC